MASAPSVLGGAEVPVWPDFGVEEVIEHKEPYLRAGGNGRSFAPAQTIWRASTDTKRPGTPIFSVWLTSSAHLSAAEARELLGIRLREAYAKAHPHWCGTR